MRTKRKQPKVIFFDLRDEKEEKLKTKFFIWGAVLLTLWTCYVILTWSVIP